MKPDTQTSNVKIEVTPSQNTSAGEYVLANNNVETTPGANIELGGRKTEQSASISDNTPITALPPVVISNTVVDDTKTSNMPLVAKDDDLIEKEWVEKAKQIVTQTKDNPHQREEKVTELHVDYLKKRFGRELGAAE